MCNSPYICLTSVRISIIENSHISYFWMGFYLDINTIHKVYFSIASGSDGIYVDVKILSYVDICLAPTPAKSWLEHCKSWRLARLNAKMSLHLKNISFILGNIHTVVFWLFYVVICPYIEDWCGWSSYPFSLDGNLESIVLKENIPNYAHGSCFCVVSWFRTHYTRRVWGELVTCIC